MTLQLIGLNHRSAPVEIRERLAEICCRSLFEGSCAPLENVAVFTCNRVEFYFHGPEQQAGEVFRKWLQTNGMNPDELAGFFYRHQGIEVVSHLFTVAAGLDSMVLGENQILHQIKTSYQNGIDVGSVGKYLHALFQKALTVGKRVRSETRISQNTVSIASTAVELATHIFGQLQECHALVIGAGEMASLVAVHLQEHGIGSMTFTNRTFTRAQDLAGQFGGKAEPFDKLADLLLEADLVISSTGAPRPILGRTELATAIWARPWRPMFLIDIAVPRDITPDVGELENIFLYDIDDLQSVVDENLDLRRHEAELARKIVADEVSSFRVQVDAFSVIPLIRMIREHGESVRQSEVDRFFPPTADLDPNILDSIQKCTRAILGKWLHHPIIRLKEKGAADPALLQEFINLFGLNEDSLEELITAANTETVKEQSANEHSIRNPGQ